METKRPGRGFTLIELLIVIAIIAMSFLGIGLPPARGKTQLRLRRGRRQRLVRLVREHGFLLAASFSTCAARVDTNSLGAA